MRLTAILVSFMILTTYSKGDDDTSKRMIVNLEDCVKESNVSYTLVDKLVGNSEYSDDSKLKCFIKCMYVKAGIMSEDGNVNVDELKKTSEDDLTVSPNVLNKCKDVKGKDNCETAFLIAKCLEEK